jgi:hypothetical protein
MTHDMNVPPPGDTGEGMDTATHQGEMLMSEIKVTYTDHVLCGRDVELHPAERADLMDYHNAADGLSDSLDYIDTDDLPYLLEQGRWLNNWAEQLDVAIYARHWFRVDPNSPGVTPEVDEFLRAERYSFEAKRREWLDALARANGVAMYRMHGETN